MKILLIISILFFSGCSGLDWMACGDRGACDHRGFLWLNPVCDCDPIIEDGNEELLLER